MPRRKGSRAPSRAKPIPTAASKLSEEEQAEREMKIKVRLENFDREVELRRNNLKELGESLIASVERIYQLELMRLPKKVKEMKWVDYVQQGKAADSRMSCISAVLEAEGLLESVAKKKGGRTRKENTRNEPQTASRTTRATRQKKVLGESDVDNMAPPTTTRAQRTRKVAQVPATPVNQGIPYDPRSSTLMITPKFDPRTPFPPGTVKRKPQLGEIGVSLAGSPLSFSPLDDNGIKPKKWAEKLENAKIDEVTYAELKEFYSKIHEILNT
ncbi:borealin-like [Oratosquilla oratoria]|uniref:borealin-like n=1 Tax=Oratosquilla oratoria TaxID=337810 RepID=UPI003F76742C